MLNLTSVFRCMLAGATVLTVACKHSGSAEKKNSEGGKEVTIASVMDGVVTRMYSTFTPSEMDTLRQDFLLTFLTDAEKEALSKRYWTFDVNVPVRVSLMRHEGQALLPFWLESSGFQKTSLLVRNEMYTYEVWQKDFPAGKVELGINGFDKHRPVYFVSVAPLSPDKQLEISNVIPKGQHFEEMRPGAFTYHDWDGLTLTEVPPALSGQKLLTTIRGRAREAHMIGAFRDTPHPSGAVPDQVLLTWSGDPATTMDVQWRTGRDVRSSEVQYWRLDDASDTLVRKASVFEMEDRLLRNDRYIHRFTAQLDDLVPGTTYGYRVGARETGWSASARFTTEAKDAQDFSFIWFGDTHYSPLFGDMAQKTLKRHPEVSFYQIAGDLVSTGLHRDDWDKLFQHAGNTFAFKPLLPIPGNHDSQDGLGAWMYREMFSLPANGPDGIPPELTYAYHYQNALFLMIDGTQPVPAQSAWIEKQLAGSKARWKFAMFHFPPYNFVEDYDEIRQEWCTLFDKYHVDMVMSGHMHYYLRTRPMFAGRPVDSPSKGTIYTMSVSIQGKQDEWPVEPYAVVRYPGGPLYQHISIQENVLNYQCYDADGKVKDQLRISK